MSFETLAGQPRVVSVLSRALEEDRLPHALLFAGPLHSGQKEAATELAKAIFCVDREGASACGVCVSCRKVERGTHPDFYCIEPEADSHVIKAEEIRALKSRASLKAFEASAKVFVIDRAECLNDVGQNALLKTLEEPEGRTFFILISSSPERLLSTIHSRVQRLNFLPTASETPEEPETQELRRQFLERLLALSAGKKPEEADFANVERELLIGVMDWLVLFFRDALMLRLETGGTQGFSENKFEKERLARSTDEEGFCRRIELLAQTKEWLVENVNTKLVINVLWDRWTAIT